MDLNLTPSKQVEMMKCKRHINMNSQQTSYEEEVGVVHEENIRASSNCDQKLDIIIHSMQNIEKAVVSMSSQIEKLVAILTPNNVAGSRQDNESLEGEGIHSQSVKERSLYDDLVNEKDIHGRLLKDDALHSKLKDIGLHNGLLKEDDLEIKSHKEEGLSKTSLKGEVDGRMKKPCSSPFLGFYTDSSSPSLQPVCKRKLEVNSEDNIKNDTCGLKKIPSEIINLQFGHHRFPSQLVTLNEMVPKISNTQKVSSKSKVSQHKKSVRCSNPFSNVIDDPKSEDTTSKKRAQTNEVNGVIEKETKLRKFKIEQGVEQAQIKSTRRKDKHVTGYMLSEITKETIRLSDTYKQYLEYLTPEEHIICMNVATWKNTSNIIYTAKGNFMDVADARTVFPGKWLCNWFIDIYLYDLHLRQEPMPKKLYLPLSFQIILSEHFEITQQKGRLFNYFNFHSRLINDFIPTDSSNIEQVYVPLNHKEGKHWFLLVIDIVERRNYVLDSLGVNDEQGSNIGVCYGLNGDNLPSPANVINLYKSCGVGNIRLYQPYPEVLEALRGSELAVAIGPLNNDIPNLAGNPNAANDWVNTNIVPYKDNVDFKWITVGNEVIPGPLSSSVPGAMNNMINVVASAGLEITVTTVVSGSALGVSYPPSAGAFSSDAPYFAYSSDPAHVSADYALFTSATAVVIDAGLEHYNLFDAMVDAFNSALEKVNFGNVNIAVAETG
ncbi:hypothetical protein GQ457_14G013040 [Hibiscus cannabinus]